MSTTKDIRTRDEIIVTVGKRDDRNADADVNRRRRGAPQTSKPNDGILKRRTKKPAINFYDLGFDRETGDIDFRVNRDPIFGPGDEIFPPELFASDYAARDAIYLAVPVASWLTRYRKVMKGSTSPGYAIFVEFGTHSGELDSLDEWQTGGLKVEQADLDSGLVISRNYLFDAVTIKDGVAGQKITATPNYTDPAVAFSPVPVMDIFLTPQLNFFSAFSTFANVAGLVFEGAHGYLYLTVPRGFFVGPSALLGQAIAGSFSTFFGGPPRTLEAYIPAYQAMQAWKSIVAGRQYTYDFSNGGPWIGGTFPVGTWPPPPAIPHIGFPLPNDYGLRSGANPAPPSIADYNGTLLAAVKKGSNWFYFWSDV